MLDVKFIMKFFIAVLLFAVLVGGCVDKIEPSFVTVPEINLNYTVDDFSTAFGKAVFLTAKVNEASIALLHDAGVDLENVEKKARSINTEIDIYALGLHISSARSINTKNIKLEAEFDNLLETYNEEIELLVPSFDEAIALGLMTIDGDEIEIWGNKFNINSIEGIATIEILNMVAVGYEMEDAVEIIQDDIEKIFVGNSSSSRGIYIKPENALNENKILFGSKWSCGIVKYRFVKGDEDWNNDLKQIAKDAMDEWTTKTDRRVKFDEITPDWWAKACNFIGQYAWIDIKIENLSGAKGIATAGAAFNTTKNSGYVKIDPKYKDDKSIYLHEFGHTLGLMHEHQRPKRNDYVKVTEKGNDYDELPEKLFPIAVKKVKIAFVTVYIPYVWYMDYAIPVNASGSSKYDFDSIMGYDSNQGVYYKNGVKFYRPDCISDTDVATVKKIY